MKQLVSVIMPTFNRRKYIGEAIDSVISQTIDEWELLIIDDGSTDMTGEFVRATYTDRRIKYFRQENQGQSVARNKGIDNSCSEFICFLDSDNRWYSNKLERQLEKFKHHPGVDIVYGDSYVIDGAGKITSSENMTRYSGEVTANLLADNFVSMNTTMTRSQVIKEIGGFNSNNRWDEDYELWLSMSINSNFLYVPEYYGEYRIMGNQISDDKESRIQANERLILKFISENPTAVSKNRKRQALSKFYQRWAYLARFEGRYKDATMHYLKALGCWPFGQNPYLGLAKNIGLWLGGAIQRR